MPPITSITRHPAIATIDPSVRWWAVALLDVWTFVGNSLYIIYEASHYRCFIDISCTTFICLILEANDDINSGSD